jgi:RNA polymerase sigma-B factor
LALIVLAVAVTAAALLAARVPLLLLLAATQCRRDALVHQHMLLADGIARSFCRRYGDLVELDDLRQEARLELVRAAARCRGDRPGPFLQRCIAGALRHHIRDRALLVRLPAKRRDAAPWRHVSLDAPAPGEEESRLEQLVCPAEPLELTEPDTSDGLTPELDALLAALPERQAGAMRLTVQEGLSLRLAGEQLGVSPMTDLRRQAGQMSSEALVQRAPRLWRGEEPIKNRRAPAGATAAVQPKEFSCEESSAAQLDAATQAAAHAEGSGGAEKREWAGHASRGRGECGCCVSSCFIDCEGIVKH